MSLWCRNWPQAHCQVERALLLTAHSEAAIDPKHAIKWDALCLCVVHFVTAMAHLTKIIICCLKDADSVVREAYYDTMMSSSRSIWSNCSWRWGPCAVCEAVVWGDGGAKQGSAGKDEEVMEEQNKLLFVKLLIPSHLDLN